MASGVRAAFQHTMQAARAAATSMLSRLLYILSWSAKAVARQVAAVKQSIASSKAAPATVAPDTSTAPGAFKIVREALKKRRLVVVAFQSTVREAYERHTAGSAVRAVL